MNNNLLEQRFQSKSKFQSNQIRHFLSLLDKRYEKSLEVGCGKGFFSFIAVTKRSINECYGCDVFDDFQVEEIKTHTNKCEYREIKKNIFPYKDNSFDLVFSMDVIEHVEDDGLFIKECLRVCKKGGTIIIGTPNYFRLTNIPLILFRRLKYPRVMGSDTYGKCIHLREYTKSQLTDMVINSQVSAKPKYKIEPCWFGVVPFNIGIGHVPAFLSGFCQFWFVKIIKK